MKHQEDIPAMLHTVKHPARAALRAGMFHAVKQAKMLHGVKHRAQTTLKGEMLHTVKHPARAVGAKASPLHLFPSPFPSPLVSHTLYSPLLNPLPKAPSSLGVWSRKSRPLPRRPLRRDGFADCHRGTLPCEKRSLTTTQPGRSAICGTTWQRGGRCGTFGRRRTPSRASAFRRRSGARSTRTNPA